VVTTILFTHLLAIVTCSCPRKPVFLPVPKLGGDSKFNVAIFNYQSSPGHPAVLAIVANSQGTSAQIVDGNQKLYFNKNGQRCSFVGERLSQHRIEKGEEQNIHKPMSSLEKQQNMLLIIQVPLKVHRPPMIYAECSFDTMGVGGLAATSMMTRSVQREKADVEDAIIKVGQEEGPFREINNLAIERDPSYPVRVTLQFYKATSNGIIDDSNVEAISTQIKESRKYAVSIGSLVVGGNSGRVTESNGVKIPLWWGEFWLMYGSVFPQFKTSQDAAAQVFVNGRFSTCTMNECQAQVLDILGKSTPNLTNQWNVL